MPVPRWPVNEKLLAQLKREQAARARRTTQRKRHGTLGDRIAIGLMKGTVCAVALGLACAVPVTGIPVGLLVLIYSSMRR